MPISVQMFKAAAQIGIKTYFRLIPLKKFFHFYLMFHGLGPRILTFLLQYFILLFSWLEYAYKPNPRSILILKFNQVLILGYPFSICGLCYFCRIGCIYVLLVFIFGLYINGIAVVNLKSLHCNRPLQVFEICFNGNYNIHIYKNFYFSIVKKIVLW